MNISTSLTDRLINNVNFLNFKSFYQISDNRLGNMMNSFIHAALLLGKNENKKYINLNNYNCCGSSQKLLT